MTVAIAAPAAPNPSREINTGSNTIFTTAPNIVPTIDAFAKPSVRSRFDGVKDKIINGAPITIPV